MYVFSISCFFFLTLISLIFNCTKMVIATTSIVVGASTTFNVGASTIMNVFVSTVIFTIA